MNALKNEVLNGLTSVFTGKPAIARSDEELAPEPAKNEKVAVSKKAIEGRGGEKEVKPAVPPQPAVQEKAQKEVLVGFSLRVPESLHQRLFYYADNFAVGRGTSVTKIMLEGIEKHLSELEKKAGIER